MREKKKPIRKWQMSLLFATIVLLIMLATMLIVFTIFAIGWKTGLLPQDDIGASALLIYFVLISLIIGAVVSTLFAKMPLAPIRKIAEAADKIAAGDYSARVSLTGPDELLALSESFNHMAKELGSVEMLRSDFVNNFSHEFKTPIVSIRGFAKMLKRDDLTPAEREEYLDTIIAESERLSELSTNVLNLTKIEQQTILTEKTSFNVSEQIRLVIAALAGKWQEKQLSFDFDCGEISLTGNENLMRQVWLNLLDNAINFSPESGTIAIRMKRTVSSVVISITNACEAPDGEAMNHLFDKFYQADRSHASGGYGLGLAIVKRIVQLHGGNVSAETANGKITFRVEIPS